MTKPSDTLPNDVEQLKAMLLSKQQLCEDMVSELHDKNQLIESLQNKCDYLLEQFRIAQQKQYGQSSEARAAQGDLFNEVEQVTDEVDVTDNSDKETISYSRNKPKRQPLPKDLPREVIVHDIDDTTCDCCGGELHQMGEDKSEQLEFIPAQIKVIEHVRPKYSCRSCESNDTKVTIKQAPMPVTAIPKSMATPSLLSQVITSKYQYALPLYRQEQLFKQHGIELNRKTMSAWMIRCASLFKPLIDALHQVLLQQVVIQADETPLKVLKEDKSKCYMWLYCSGMDKPGDSDIRNIVLYDYQASRSGQCAVNYLQGYDGNLQVDGYQGYEQTAATLAGCWAHARRKFVEAQKAQGNTKAGKAQWAINHIQKLYRIEQSIRDKTPDEKQAIRQEKSEPLLKQFKAWLDKSESQVPPKSAIGKAITYSLNQWDKLTQYVESGYITIDNNRAERAIKPFVIGRKNWLFANTASGAQASAILYSLIETAKANGLTPFNYLMYLLEELPKEPDNLEYLMPWNVELEQTV
jgi:transposase